MKNNHKTETSAPPSGHSLSARIAAFALFAAGLTAMLAALENATREQIADNQAQYSMKVVAEVLPAGYTNIPAREVVLLNDASLGGDGAELPAYIARRDGQFIAAALTVVAPDGYVGPIKLLVGIEPGGRIIRVRPVEHRETPGLGDKIEITRSDWISLFDNKNSAEPGDWVLKRDGGRVDHITGATITSRTIAQAVYAARAYFLANPALFMQPEPGAADSADQGT